MDSPPVNEICSVCHETFTIPVQSNCSHWFCGHCILGVWHYGSALQPCKCPLCRREITLLIPSSAAQRRRYDPEFSQALENIEKYNRLFGGSPPGLLQGEDLPFLMRRLARELMDPQRSLPLVFKVRIFVAMLLSLVYVLSPVDILPERVLGIVGLLDDLIILLVVFFHLAAIYRSILVYRHGGS